MVDANGWPRDPAATCAAAEGHHQGVSEETTEAPEAPEPDSAAPDSVEPDSAAPDSPQPEPVAQDSAAADSVEPDSAAPDSPEPEPEPVAPLVVPRRLVFRVPASSYVVIAFLALCVSFVAVASPVATLVYLLPLAAVVWVMRTRTEVDAERLVVRTVFFRTVLPWSKVASLRVAERRWIRAVRTDGGEITLPTVRTRHLPALALISGGRLTDPTADHPEHS